MTRSTEDPVRRRNVPDRCGAVLAAALLLALSLGCGDAEEAAPARGTAQPPARPAQDLVGEVDMGTEGLPEGFPSDLPLYPGSAPTRWMAAEGPGALVVFDADAKPEVVFDHFKKELPVAGWEVAQASQANPKHWSVFASKSGRNARISIAPAESGSQYGIAVADAD